MTATWWLVLFIALLLVLVVLALRARRLRPRDERDRANPYSSGDDTSPHDSEFGRDSDLDIDRRRESDFDDRD
jgi:hypothetical protein